jgi:hypothetical protein
MYAWIPEGSDHRIIEVQIRFCFFRGVKIRKVGFEWAVDFTFFL